MTDATPPKKNRIVGPGRIRLRFDVTGNTAKACNEEAARAANQYFQGRPHQHVKTDWTHIHYTNTDEPQQTINGHYTYLGQPE